MNRSELIHALMEARDAKLKVAKSVDVSQKLEHVGTFAEKALVLPFSEIISLIEGDDNGNE